MSDIQAALERLYCPPLDGSLVAAIAHEPDQTLQSAKEVCHMLALDTDPAFSLPEDAGDGAASALIRSASPPPLQKAGRRKGFGSKLTTPTTTAAHDFASTSSAPSPTSSGSSSPGVSTPPTSDEGSIERLLEEWKLIDTSSADPDNLRLTDDEEHHTDGEHTEGDVEERLTKEMTLLGHEVGEGHLDPAKIASGEEGIVEGLSKGALQAATSSGDADSGLLFLIHAFPSRTPGFIEETLTDCHGDVQVAIDTLMVLDLVESEEVRGQDVDWDAGEQGASSSKKGLDDDKLESGWTTAKGKKRRAERKRLQREQLRDMGIEPGGPIPGTPGAASKGKANATVVNLTDVRHGASVKANDPRSLKAAQKARAAPAPGANGTKAAAAEGLDDDAFAAYLANEERRQAGEPGVDQPVTDNAWLLSSSVLSQLCTLVEIPQAEAQSTYVQSSFNLHIAAARIVDKAADRWPTLSSLDGAGSPPAPQGTAATMALGISSLTGRPLGDAETALRATMGRQDAAIDLLQLLETIRTAAPGEAPDALDPLGRFRDGPVELPQDNATFDGQRGVTVAAGASSGRFGKGDEFPLPGAKGKGTTTSSSSGYAASAAAPRPTRPHGAAAAIQSGSASYTTLPASAAAIPSVDDSILATRYPSGLGTHQSSFDPHRRAAECRLISDDYRAKRDENLRKAAAAYRSSGLRSAVPRTRNGRMMGTGGGAAWYYAEEARRLDAKSRAWSLRAAQALVEDRRRATVGVVGGVRPVKGGATTSNGFKPAPVIDLHGVTVHEALTITRDVLNEWWATPSHRSAGSLQIITGVGKHSPHHVAVLKPAVVGMLKREGWRAEVDHHRGVITVRGLAKG